MAAENTQRIETMIDDLFNYARGKMLAEQGIEQASLGNEEWISKARQLARQICQLCGTVTADDLRLVMPEPSNPNVWGAVFRTLDFQFTGQYKQSSLVSRHAGIQRVWRLNPETKTNN